MAAINSKEAELKKQLEDVFNLAKMGDLKNIGLFVEPLSHSNPDIRIKAAWYCGQVGFQMAITGLKDMALHDPISDNRNQAIYALGAIGHVDVVDTLIEILDDEDEGLRIDAQTALYRMLGREVLVFFEQDEDERDGEVKDGEASKQVIAWWVQKKVTLQKDSVYAMGKPASPGVYIEQLKTTSTSLPDSLLNALHNWTGKDFGQKPISKVIAQWQQWWQSHQKEYLPGIRYFYGHKIP